MKQLTSGDVAGSDKLIGEIGLRLRPPDIGGESARIIIQANSQQASLVAALATKTRRLKSHAVSYKENPRQLVRQLWLEAVRKSIRHN